MIDNENLFPVRSRSDVPGAWLRINDFLLFSTALKDCDLFIFSQYFFPFIYLANKAIKLWI